MTPSLEQSPAPGGDLFGHDSAANLLPCDGTVHYFGPVLDAPSAGRYFEALLRNIPWQHDEAVFFGRRVVTAREVAWYGDAAYAYTYSGATKRALAWTNELRELKALVAKIASATFNSCLLNLYHDGSEGMAWHSDDEKMLRPNAAIASLSFGAERRFCFKHKRTQETVALMLEHGSLLVMKDTTQAHWLHSLPKAKKITTPRINLTFRSMGDS